MALFQMLNNVVMTLGVSLSPLDTELTVMDRDLPDADRYDPTKQLALTLLGDEELNQYEIVYATSRTGTTFTVLRGQEDTVAATWPAGTKVIAALTSGMLARLSEVPTTASAVQYEGGNFGQAGTVEETLDDMGDSIIRLMATTDYHEDVLERVSGSLLAGSTVLGPADILRWQAGGGRITTDGFGADKVCTVAIAPPVVPPDIVLCIRSADMSNFASFKVRAYNNAAPTNSLTWTLASLTVSPNTWEHIWLGAANATVSGDPGTNLPDRIEITLKDNATGPLVMDVNFIDVAEAKSSYIGSFIRVLSNADFDKVWAIEKFGFQVSPVMRVEDLEAGTIDWPTLREAETDGNRIFLTSGDNFKAQTANQILVTLFKGVRLASEANLRPAGFVYPGFYNGPLDIDPTISVRDLVLRAYPRGAGVRSFRSVVEVYRFDDALNTVATLADANALLLGTDNRSINVDVTALSVADLNTLYSNILISKKYYQTSFAWQNADNIKSGTLDAARLPVVPIAKGGTGNVSGYGLCPIGTVLPFAGPNIPAGWLACNGAAVSRSTYAQLFNAISTYWGAGNGSTTFNVPNLMNRVIGGYGGGWGFGALLGEFSHQLTEAEMPVHLHGVTATGSGSGSSVTDFAGQHSHPNANNSYTVAATSGWSLRPAGGESAENTGAAGLHRHTFGVTVAVSVSGATDARGGNQPHNVIQPTAVMWFIIRAVL